MIDEIKAMASLDTSVKNRPQHGIARLKVGELPVHLRISVIPYVTGESIVIRIWDANSFRLDFDKLGFSNTQAEMMKRWANSPNGVIAFTGPDGSGKTTTLYGVLGSIDASQRKIVTAEDPVYVLLNGVNQLQIEPSQGLTYATAIREQMHQDIDVMMVGECRDKEVLDFICRGALTGHLLMTQLHAGSCADALSLFIQMGGDPYALNRSILGIVSQRLVRLICPKCKEAYRPKDWERESLGIAKDAMLHRSKGCEHCGGRGYRGRAAVYEMLELNDDLRSAIARKASREELAELAIASGMTTLKEHAMEKAMQGLTTVDEVMRIFVSPKATPYRK